MNRVMIAFLKLIWQMLISKKLGCISYLTAKDLFLKEKEEKEER